MKASKNTSKRRSVFLSAQWRSLVTLNYEVDSVLLTKYLPHGTELDLLNGRALVSVVGFRFLSTRVFGVPIPFHQNFDEVNLRFYVQREGDTVKRGVVFIQEIVPLRLVASTARFFYGENYRPLPMAHHIEVNHEGECAQLCLQYAWRLGSRWTRITAAASGKPAESAEGSEEQFVTEHYWGYSNGRNGTGVEYRVDHAPWRLLKASSAELDGDTEELFGPEFARVLGRKPNSAFLSEGSPVTVYTPSPLDS